MEEKELHACKEPMKMKRPTTPEVNFNHGSGQKIIRSLRSQTYPLLSHFQNDGASVESTTLVLLQIQLAILCY